MSCFVLGIDPDLHNTAAAIIGTSGLFDVKVFNVSLTHKGPQAVTTMIEELTMSMGSWLLATRAELSAVVVEGQQIYSYTKARHDSILMLAQVAGAAAAVACMRARELWIPTPKQWKGDVPKGIHQARTLTKLGVRYTKTTGKEPYCIPDRIPGINVPKKSDWKHAVDAIGLAVWGLEKATGVRL